MNTSAKGRRNEHRSMRLLEAAGYQCVRSAGSMGVFDFVAIGATDFVLVQVKSARPPSPAEVEQMQRFVCPKNTRRFIHVWKDRKHVPDVREVT